MALYPQIEKEQFTPYTEADGSISTPGRFYIRIYDSNTGQLATASNLDVTYRRDANGNVTQTTANINGQELLIYDGVVSTYGNTTYYVNFDLVGYGPGAGTPGTGGSVQITDIQIIKKADVNGLNGTVKTYAYSTYLPIRYFIDDIELPQEFSGLSAGNHTFKVIDANGNQDSRSLFMPQTYNILVGTPAVDIGGGKISRWNAAFNPILFTYQRKDFTVTQVQQSGVSIVVVTQEDLTGIKQGEYIYLEAGPYKARGKVTSQLHNQLAVDIPWNGNATGFMNSDSLRPYYKVETEITYYDKDSGTNVTKTYSHSPNPLGGKTIADLSGLLKSMVRAKDDSNYDQQNYLDTNLFAAYTIRYRETWDNYAAEWFSAGNTFYVAYAAMQLQSPFGGNMGQYVTFRDGSSAKFLTDFKQPCFSPGYPFDLGFIYADSMAGGIYNVRVTKLDINRKPIDGATNYVLAERFGLNRLLFNQAYANNVWYLSLDVAWDIGGPVTETKIIRIDKAIDVNSVYLRWIGYSGSWEYYRFVWNQERTLNLQNAVTISKYEYDIATSQGAEETISKEAARGIKVFAEDLSQDDIRGLESLKVSPKVQWLASKNPRKWQTVTIGTGSTTEYETQLGTYAFQLAFTLPAINVQTQ